MKKPSFSSSSLRHLFNGGWYLSEYRDVSAAGMHPYDHYVRYGVAEGRDPNPIFDTDWYLKRWPEVAAIGMNPLEHYVNYGASQGRDPSPLFDSGWYLSKNPDVAAAGLNPLEHYISNGASEGRDPNPLFDTDWYLSRYPEVAASRINPLGHYIKYGIHHGYDPNPLFDTDWYLGRYTDVAASGMNPLEHYMAYGWKEGRDPHPLFDTDWYLSRNSDASLAGGDPLQHYIHHGAFEGRDPHPLFDTRYYYSQIPGGDARRERPVSGKQILLQEARKKETSKTPRRSVVYVFTSICLNYLPKARILAETLKRHNPEIRFHLLINEPVDEDLLGSVEWCDELTTVEKLPIRSAARWIFRHSLVELSTAVKGMYMLELLERDDCKLAFYFDPDIAVFSPLDPLTSALETGSILLTPHLTAPESAAEAIMDNEICSLKHGIYNLGFLGVRPSDEGLRFARWWRDRLLHFCRADIPGGLFTDQRWVDLAPAFFPETHILRHPGCNVATWNLNNRQIEGSVADGFTVNGVPLIFYHFSGFDSGAQEIMLNRYGAKMPAANELREWYIANTERTEDKNFSSKIWRYSHFSNGEPITPAHRLLFRDRLDLQMAFPNPFDASNPACSFHHWYESAILGRPSPTRHLAASANALEHYLRVGGSEGLDPNPYFDGEWYLTSYPDVAAAGMDPFFHYVTAGAAEGKYPGPWFYPDWYIKKAPEKIALEDALAHYLEAQKSAIRENGTVNLRIDCLFDRRFDTGVQQRIADWGSGKCAVVLLISHFGGGGTEKHLHDLVQAVGDDVAFLRLIPSYPDRLRGTVVLSALGAKDAELCFDPILQFDDLLETLKACKLDQVHIHHGMGNEHYLQKLVQALGVPFDFTVHDYYVLSPSPHLIGLDSRFVGEDLFANEDKLLAASLTPDRPASLKAWQEEHRWLVEDAARVICPSRDVARRLERHFSGLRITVAAHPEERQPAPNIHLEPVDDNEGGRLRIAILGGLGPHKGSEVVFEVGRLAMESKHPIAIDLIGYASTTALTLKDAGIWCSGEYRDSEVLDLIAKREPHLLWFPALCPESFSYTLSIAMEAGLPIVAPDLGSFQDRLSDRAWTWICPWDRSPADWLAFFLRIREENFMTSIPPARQTATNPPGSEFYETGYLMRTKGPRRKRVAPVLQMLTLDPPYRLSEQDEHKVFIGWGPVDRKHPSITAAINGVPVDCEMSERADVEKIFPQLAVKGILLRPDLKALFQDERAEFDPEAFLLCVSLSNHVETRVFEYEVSQQWINRIFEGSSHPLPKPMPMPPDFLQIRVSGAAAGGFYRTGREVADGINAILSSEGFEMQRFEKILDFGCGCGRLVSLIRKLAPQAQLYGCDIDAEAIDWCRANLSHFAEFSANPEAPPTQYPDASFDFIYSISIFTHLPEAMQVKWLIELHRLLKPGGILLTTVLNPRNYNLDASVAKVAESQGFAFHEEAPGTEGLPGFYRLAYHTHDYIEKTWSQWFEVLRIGSNDLNNTQDSVLCRKPASH